MASRKPFALRIDEQMLLALQRWADDELRSVNAQIEYALRDALRRAGRWPRQADKAAPSAGQEAGDAED